MATIKSEYYRFNGTDWDLFYFKTAADLIVETTTYKVLTAAERTKISDYLTTFNAANKLAQVEAGGKLPVGIIPDLSSLYLTKNNPTFSGTIFGTQFAAPGNTPSIGLDPVYGDMTLGGTGLLNIVTFDRVDIDATVNMQSHRIINLGSPQTPQDAANKEYVDNLVSAGFKVADPVKAASTANVNIAVALNALDGYTLAANDRVLLKDQSTASQNGVYVLNASKIPQKVTADSELGHSVFVEHGSTYNDYIFVHSTQDSWKVFTKPDTVKAGAGLTKIGTTISIPDFGITDMMIESIHVGKIQDFKFFEGGTSWSEVEDSGTETTITNHLEALATAIKLLRGTANFNTNNTQTIAGAYALANTKIKSEIGTTVPGTSGYTAGDLFFKTL